MLLFVLLIKLATMKTTVVLSFLSLFGLCVCSPLQYYSIDNAGHIQQIHGVPTFDPKLAAYAKYAQTINETGWAQLEVVSNPKLADEVQAYYAGYLEGFITNKLITPAVYNMLPYRDLRCKYLKQFIGDNLEFVLSEVKNKSASEPYWHEVGLVYYQLAGMDDGYGLAIDNHTKVASPHNHIDPCGLVLLNMHAEFFELDKMLNITKEGKHQAQDHCSAIIKILPNNEDVLTAHNTWGYLGNMLRVFKRYTLNFGTSKAKSVAMSSYPGTIFSFDDYFITSQNLVVQETTNEYFGRWPEVKANEIVFEFVRNIVANRLARTGIEWSRVFQRYNSGTYNNQFMIVNYKHFVNKTIHYGFLTILEQFPGEVIYSDKTETLLRQGYWASYNVPYYRTMYLEGGWDVMRAEYGDYYDHNLTARARIFARDHAKVTNMSTLFHLMRYNNFKVDPISRCNCTPPYTAHYAIAARNDLNDPKGRYPILDNSFYPHVAYDAKMTSAKLVPELVSVAVNGPTDENVEPFDWTTTKVKGVRHRDQPNRWTFKPVLTRWNSNNQSFSNFNFDF